MSAKATSTILILLCQLLLACGGSGGDDNSPPPSGTLSSSSVSSSANTTSSSVSSVSLPSSIASSSLSSFSSSNTSSSASQISSLAAPQNFTVSVGSESVTLQWSPVAGATSYHIYYATEPNILPQNYAAYNGGTWVQNVSSPRVINNLVNGQIYYFVVTAANGSVESAGSLEVNAAPVAPMVSTAPSAQEVLAVELVNRARFDPAAEAQRYGIGLNDGGVNISPDRKPPLAHNPLLIKAARAHSQWMLDNNIFSHTGDGDSSAAQRMMAAGYNFGGSWAAGENIAVRGVSGNTINLTQSIYSHHEGLFKSSGHRENILSTHYRELGIGQRQGQFRYSGGDVYLSSMLTQNFARSGNNYFLTGVIYQDENNNSFYDVGEGLSGITLTIGGQVFTNYDSGAYAIPLTNGSYSVTVAGGSLGETVQEQIHINGSNIKLDILKTTGSSLEVVTW